jgi:CheY-like chemotaxis protein
MGPRSPMLHEVLAPHCMLNHQFGEPESSRDRAPSSDSDVTQIWGPNTDERPVLVVDDDRDVREALVELLAGRGFRVTAAADGREALQILRALRVPPFVVLLDLMMPVMDGYEFLAAQRNDPSIAAVPVAVVTAAHGVDLQRLGGTVSLIRKPLDVPLLMKTLLQLQEAGRRA